MCFKKFELLPIYCSLQLSHYSLRNQSESFDQIGYPNRSHFGIWELIRLSSFKAFNDTYDM
jgi:hypothetical protein